jgi:hypothetical protein
MLQPTLSRAWTCYPATHIHDFSDKDFDCLSHLRSSKFSSKSPTILYAYFKPQKQSLLYKMAAVYKSLSKGGSEKNESSTNGIKKNKQRVLILSSRGVTYRQVLRRWV